MTKVETSRPMTPLVTPLSRMEMAELVAVLPSSSVHSSRLPCSRTAAGRRGEGEGEGHIWQERLTGQVDRVG